MSQESEPNERLDPAATLRQAAGLATHLERIGAQWLPTPDPDSVTTLAEQFRSAASEAPASLAPASLAPASEAPASEAPASAPESENATVQTAPTSTAPDISQPPAIDRPGVRPASPPVTTSPTNPQSAVPFTLSVDSASQLQPYPGPSLSPDQRVAQLAECSSQVGACTRCEILSKCRTKTVFGEGSANPRIVFFGEGPGRDEDLSGRPFVGKAGQLLTKMIQACQFSREDVYIMNTVKCRPPNNRNPEPTEVENCREYFEAQLNLLRPEYIVCLGLVSAQALLRTKLSVGRMRGKFHKHFDSKVVVTYHPSYLLRTPAAKKAAWEDLQLMLRDAGLM